MEKGRKFLSVEVDYSEAKEWADIISLTNDIDSTIQICDRLIHHLAATSEDRIIIESLWTTALIKYARFLHLENGLAFRMPYLMALMAIHMVLMSISSI